MPQLNTSRLEGRSRLARVLSNFSEQNLLTPESNLAERLGHLVGVSGSMNLARGLKMLPQSSATGARPDYQEVQKTLLDGRSAIVANIVRGFRAEPSAESQNTLPSVASGLRVEALKSFEPYQRFYTTHQIEMAVAIKSLRQQIRQSLTSTSCGMHQLAALDMLIEESLETHIRKLFNTLPKVLEKQFIRCREKYPDLATWSGEDNEWLQPFFQDMRELLLAEFDIRFQPLLGLLEALQEQT